MMNSKNRLCFLAGVPLTESKVEMTNIAQLIFSKAEEQAFDEASEHGGPVSGDLIMKHVDYIFQRIREAIDTKIRSDIS